MKIIRRPPSELFGATKRGQPFRERIAGFGIGKWTVGKPLKVPNKVFRELAQDQIQAAKKNFQEKSLELIGRRALLPEVEWAITMPRITVVYSYNGKRHEPREISLSSIVQIPTAVLKDLDFQIAEELKAQHEHARQEEQRQKAHRKEVENARKKQRSHPPKFIPMMRRKNNIGTKTKEKGLIPEPGKSPIQGEYDVTYLVNEPGTIEARTKAGESRRIYSFPVKLVRLKNNLVSLSKT